MGGCCQSYVKENKDVPKLSKPQVIPVKRDTRPPSIGPIPYVHDNYWWYWDGRPDP